MAEELLTVLTRFHREIILPDMQTLVREEVRAHRNETLEGFDVMSKQFETLRIEYYALNAALRRVEDRVTHIEDHVATKLATKEDIDRLALRAEILELSERVDEIEQRVDEMETKL